SILSFLLLTFGRVILSCRSVHSWLLRKRTRIKLSYLHCAVFDWFLLHSRQHCRCGVRVPHRQIWWFRWPRLFFVLWYVRVSCCCLRDSTLLVTGTCNAGRYGKSTGLTTALCTGPCAANYYCPAGSTKATQNTCPSNSQSPTGSAAQTDCVCNPG